MTAFIIASSTNSPIDLSSFVTVTTFAAVPVTTLAQLDNKNEDTRKILK